MNKGVGDFPNCEIVLGKHLSYTVEPLEFETSNQYKPFPVPNALPPSEVGYPPPYRLPPGPVPVLPMPHFGVAAPSFGLGAYSKLNISEPSIPDATTAEGFHMHSSKYPIEREMVLTDKSVDGFKSKIPILTEFRRLQARFKTDDDIAGLRFNYKEATITSPSPSETLGRTNSLTSSATDSTETNSVIYNGEPFQEWSREVLQFSRTSYPEINTDIKKCILRNGEHFQKPTLSQGTKHGNSAVGAHSTKSIANGNVKRDELGSDPDDDINAIITVSKEAIEEEHVKGEVGIQSAGQRFTTKKYHQIKEMLSSRFGKNVQSNSNQFNDCEQLSGQTNNSNVSGCADSVLNNNAHKARNFDANASFKSSIQQSLYKSNVKDNILQLIPTEIIASQPDKLPESSIYQRQPLKSPRVVNGNADNDSNQQSYDVHQFQQRNFLEENINGGATIANRASSEGGYNTSVSETHITNACTGGSSYYTSLHRNCAPLSVTNIDDQCNKGIVTQQNEKQPNAYMFKKHGSDGSAQNIHPNGRPTQVSHLESEVSITSLTSAVGNNATERLEAKLSSQFLNQVTNYSHNAGKTVRRDAMPNDRYYHNDHQSGSDAYRSTFVDSDKILGSKAMEGNPDHSPKKHLKDTYFSAALDNTADSDICLSRTAGMTALSARNTVNNQASNSHWRNWVKINASQQDISSSKYHQSKGDSTSTVPLKTKMIKISLNPTTAGMESVDGDVTSTTTGLDLDSVIDAQSNSSDEDETYAGDAQTIQRQLEGLESMYSEVLQVLGVKRLGGKTGISGGNLFDARGLRRRPGGSISSLPSSVSSRPFRDKKKHDEKKKVRDLKGINKRFQRLESHVVTLARSVAHLSSEMRTQHIMIQEIEHIQSELAQIREYQGRNDAIGAQYNNSNIYCSHPLQSQSRPSFREWLPNGPYFPHLAHPARVEKLTKFFGDEPPLLRLFLKKLGYEKYAYVFETEKVGLLELPFLGEDRLQKMGIPLGPRLRILQEAHMTFQDETILQATVNTNVSEEKDCPDSTRSSGCNPAYIV